MIDTQSAGTQWRKRREAAAALFIRLCGVATIAVFVALIARWSGASGGVWHGVLLVLAGVLAAKWDRWLRDNGI